jgi:hypothetical protein
MVLQPFSWIEIKGASLGPTCRGETAVAGLARQTGRDFLYVQYSRTKKLKTKISKQRVARKNFDDNRFRYRLNQRKRELQLSFTPL